MEADVDVVVVDEACGASLPAAAEVDSHVRLGVEVADIAGSAAVFGDQCRISDRVAVDVAVLDGPALVGRARSEELKVRCMIVMITIVIVIVNGYLDARASRVATRRSPSARAAVRNRRWSPVASRSRTIPATADAAIVASVIAGRWGTP